MAALGRLSCLLASVALSLAMATPAGAEKFNRDLEELCRGCNPYECPQPPLCPAGLVKDSCDCCLVCGKKEGEQCDVDVDNDPRALFSRARYTPIHGRCGESLQCLLREDIDRGDDLSENAVCVCRDERPVCGEDNKTYRNKCHFDEVTAGRSKTLRVLNFQPCDEVPQILEGPKSVEEFQGESVSLSCEVSGYPPPKIEWTQTMQDGSVLIMPGDDLKKSVQARGGPDHYQVTGWLQIQGLGTEDEGTYTCIAKNKFGEAKSSATLKAKRSSDL